MDQDIEKIIAHMEEPHLTADEKNRVRSALMAEMEKAVRIPSPYHNPIFSWATFIYTKKSYILATLFVLVAGSSLLFGATTSLPGDVLYPLKTDVNEPFLRALSKNSKVSSAEFEVSLMETRLLEAQELTQRGTVPTQNKQEVINNIAVQSQRVQNAVQELAQSEPDDDVVTVVTNTNPDNSDPGNTPVASHVSATADQINATTLSATTSSTTPDTQPQTQSQPKMAPQARAFSAPTSEAHYATDTATSSALVVTPAPTSTPSSVGKARKNTRDILERVDRLLKKYRPTIQLLEEDSTDPNF